MIVANLKTSRLVLGLTQEDVALKMKVDDSTVSGWECGKDTIPLRRLIQYAITYKFNLDYLFGIDDTIDEDKVKSLDIALDLELIATNLRTLRERKKITQSFVAAKINTSQSTYSQYENARYLISATFLYNLIDIFDIDSIDKLLTEKFEN